MSNKISTVELARLAYVSDYLVTLQAVEASLKGRVREQFPEGRSYVETDAGTILVDVIPSGEEPSQVSVRYADG